MHHEMVQDYIKQHLNVTHFNRHFLETIVCEGLDEKVRDRVNEPVNHNILHGFVQNRAVLIQILVRRMLLLEKLIDAVLSTNFRN
jgi:hypothetical protein